MIFPALEKIEDKLKSKFLLTIVVSERAKQLKAAEGHLPAGVTGHPITAALEELKDADITIDLSHYLEPQELPPESSALASVAKAPSPAGDDDTEEAEEEPD
jgi:DNA-directed RNA polymerase subunit K/omega